MVGWSAKAIATIYKRRVILRRSMMLGPQPVLELVLLPPNSEWAAGHVFLSPLDARALATALMDYADSQADDPAQT